MKPLDTHREMCDIYGEGQRSNRVFCGWVAKFTTGQQQQQQQRRVTLERDAPSSKKKRSGI